MSLVSGAMRGEPGGLRTGSWSLWSAADLLALPPPGLGPAVVALGTFDGVHLGHARILAEAVTLGRSLGCAPVAFTFDRHPMLTLAPERAPRALTPLSERVREILRSGIEHVVVVRFDGDFAALGAGEFLERIVCRALGARGVVVGYNFRFGRGAAGSTVDLERGAALHGYTLQVVPPVSVDGVPVSSTRIRAAVQEGRMEEAVRLLGRPFAACGPVVRGDARGRTLGYPTANVETAPELVLPPDGVYLSRVLVRDGGENAGPPGDGAGNAEGTPALAVLSDRPSFATGRRTLECFLLDFSGDLYGREVEVRFLSRLRGIVRVASVEELTGQIARDVAAARAYFAAE